MFKLFSTLFKLMLVSMFSFHFGHGDSSMYRYRKVQQSRPYTVVSCSLIRLSSLSQCAAVAGRSKSVTFFFHTDVGSDGYLCRWDCIFMNSYSSSELCNLPCTAFGKRIYLNYSLKKHVHVYFTANFVHTQLKVWTLQDVCFLKYEISCISLKLIIFDYE